MQTDMENKGKKEYQKFLAEYKKSQDDLKS